MDFNNGIWSLKQIIKKDGFRKPIYQLIPDLIKWTYKNKGGIHYFYLLGLHQKGKDLRGFITESEYMKIHDELDPAYYRPLLEDKIIFDRYIRSFNIPTPDLIGIIESGTIFWIDENKHEVLLSDQDQQASI